jgi:tRNA pseudouridine38-40 synthase
MRYKITFEYNGGKYCGFQKQPDQPNNSVEEIIENAVFELTQERVKIFASGRTDAGVHALAQVAHFDLTKKFSEDTIVSALNNYLRPEDIAVIDCELVDENFHARFSAKMRHYRYILVNRRAPLTLQKNLAWHIPRKLDLESMKDATKFLIGEKDFSSFRDSNCQAKSAIKNISKIEIIKNGDEIFIEISARSFLHHMVRNIVGTLIWVGSGKIKSEEMKNILESRDRTKSGSNAPACGLYFLRVDY